MLYWKLRGIRIIAVLGICGLSSAVVPAQGKTKGENSSSLSGSTFTAQGSAASQTINSGFFQVSGGTLTLSSGSLITNITDSSSTLTLSTGNQNATIPLAALTTVDPFGTLKQTLNYSASRLILDAPRHRIYGSDNINNRVLVFDTTSNTLLTTVPVGSAPYGLAITPDGSTLYVANSGSTTAAISVVDLNTLTVSSTLAASVRLYNLAVGLNGRIYASAYGSSQTAAIVQIDPANPASAVTFGSFTSAELAISPDLKTLYVGDGYQYSGSLSKYDISTATATLSQKSTANGYNGNYNIDLQLNHSGSTLLYFNAVPMPAIPTSDLNGVSGSFNSAGNSISAAAFSADDSIVYTITGSYYGTVRAFDAAHYTPAGSFTPPDSSYSFGATALITDEGNHFLYVNTGSKISVYATGRKAPTLPSTLAANGGKDVSFSYQIPADQNPTSFTATGLPAGLALGQSSGIIYGKPTQTGTYSVVVSASNGIGTAQASLTITIGEALQVSISGWGSVTPGLAGTSYPKVGDTVTINAFPAADQQFLGWTGSRTSTANPLTFTMQAGDAVQANFGPIAPTITSSLTISVTDDDYLYYQITTDHPATSFTASSLPPGLSLSQTGYLSGYFTQAGNAAIAVTASNAGGSDTKTLSFVITAYLQINTNGGGSVTGLDNGNYLEIGKAYSSTAIAEDGYIFTGWTGSITSAEATLGFVMSADLSLQANFLYRGDLAGKYLGLIEDEETAGASGCLTLVVNTNGAFNGTAQLNGKSVLLSGKFADDGTAAVVVNGTAFALRATEIYGDLEVAGTATIGGVEIPLRSKRSSFTAKNASGFSGPLVLSLPAADPSDTTVPPDAALKVHLAQNGLVQITGKLSDGTKVASATRLRDDSSFLVYLPLYGDKGILSGVMTYDPNYSAFVGTLTWVKSPNVTPKYKKTFPAGFSTQLSATTNPAAVISQAKAASAWTETSAAASSLAISWSRFDPSAAAAWIDGLRKTPHLKLP